MAEWDEIYLSVESKVTTDIPTLSVFRGLADNKNIPTPNLRLKAPADLSERIVVEQYPSHDLVYFMLPVVLKQRVLGGWSGAEVESASSQLLNRVRDSLHDTRKADHPSITEFILLRTEAMDEASLPIDPNQRNLRYDEITIAFIGLVAR